MAKKTKISNLQLEPSEDRIGLIKPLHTLSDRFQGKDAMSTPHIWGLINKLCKGKRVYLEVGSWQGATLCAAAYNNPNMICIGVDNFADPDKRERNAAALWNNARYFGNILLYPDDFRKALKRLAEGNLKVDVYLFDGPHMAEDQRDGLEMALPMLHDDSIIIVDDANWGQVREETEGFCDRHGWEVIFERYTVANGSPDWWNGVMVLAKTREG